jgi:CDP-diacylglycerol--glycerol-3-phosphate 3-phosphatidyltransferase
LLVTLVPFLDWELWEMILIAAVIAVRIAAFIIGSIRFGRPAFVHSYLNKAAGAVFFLSPFLIGPIGLPATVAIAGIVCVSASLEYLLISIRSREYDPDYRSVFLDRM